MMPNPDLNRLLESVARHETPPSVALQQLRAAGHLDADDLVLFSLGGATIIEIGADGREHYPSGRLVADVQADMAR